MPLTVAWARSRSRISAATAASAASLLRMMRRIEYTVERFVALPCNLSGHLSINSLLYRSPSINNQGMPGKKLRVHQVGDGISYIAWLSGAAKRCVLDEVRLPFLGITWHRDRSRGDGIHAHFRRQRFRQDFRQHHHPSFRNRVCNVARPAEQTAGIRKIDDCPACSPQQRRRRLCAEKRRFQIRIERSVPNFFGGGNDARWQKICRAVDEDVQPAELFCSFVKKPLDLRNAA